MSASNIRLLLCRFHLEDSESVIRFYLEIFCFSYCVKLKFNNSHSLHHQASNFTNSKNCKPPLYKKIHKLIKAKKEKKGEILIWDLDGGGNEARMASFSLSLSLSLSLSNGFEEAGEEINWFDDKYGG